MAREIVHACADFSVIPSFIVNDNYCDSGSDNYPSAETFYTDSMWKINGYPLCCSNSEMLWICKTLPEPTVDNIKVQLLVCNCHNSPSTDEDTAVSPIELYI